VEISPKEIRKIITNGTPVAKRRHLQLSFSRPHEVTGFLWAPPQLPPLLLRRSSVVLLVAVVGTDGRAVGGRGGAVSGGGGAVRGAFRTSWRVRRGCG